MIAIEINIDFDKVEKKDLFIFISKLEQSNKGDWLKHDYKVCIKKFYKWHFKDDNPSPNSQKDLDQYTFQFFHFHIECQ